jgi:outer membrane protein assembly factor BamD
MHWFAIIIFLLSACTSDSTKPNLPDKTLYEMGVSALDRQDYAQAQSKFGLIEKNYPYSPLSADALLLQSYALYAQGEHGMADLALDRFLTLYPKTSYKEYAYYLKAINLHQDLSAYDRDIDYVRKTAQAWVRVMALGPESIYTQDASVKWSLTQALLAQNDMQIGAYYLERGHYLAAMKRFLYVLTTYPQSIFIPEALYRLMITEWALGLEEEALLHYRLLNQNFPGTLWQKAGKAVVMTH